MERQKENKRWDRLIDAILAGDVIPVVGSDFLVETEDGGIASFPDHHKQLIDVLAQICELRGDVANFSQLIYHPEFNKWTDGNPDFIYPLISEVLLQLIEQRTLQPSHLLMKLLKTRLFPFVITTSFSPVTEEAMREAWGGEQVRVLQYRNDSKRDLTVGIGDISCEAEMLQPTVYYMFGKCSAEPHRFVVSDLDMMDFCKSWLAGGNKVPRMLTEVLKKKYLLVLGNNYSDWLFRFVWYSLRNTPDMMRNSMIVNSSLEPTLVNFLEQLQTFIKNDPATIIHEIVDRINKKRKYVAPARRQRSDVFLSYSRSDVDVAQRVKEALQANGLTVWFDKDSIPEGSDWRTAIENGIRNSRLFVPLLTHNVETEYLEPHEYRVEWLTAADIADKMGGRKFIWPLAVEGFDFHNEQTKVPQQLKDKNATWFKIPGDFTEFAEAVMSEIDNLKVKEREMEDR